ncbi:hypothetical protein IE4803_CH01061 [Rhizobium etli bv. phaseoli str. IE4803]|nr:hypothetical protein IE4803_CH01061 [Rhizobium etli bv. phaseoli str. IE4803]
MWSNAAPRLRNAAAVSMDDDVEEVLRDVAGELGMTRNDTISYIVREWMGSRPRRRWRGRRKWLTGVMLDRNSVAFTTD